MVTRAEFEDLAAKAGVEVKGKKNPYASKNGHMFAFLSETDGLCVRFSEERRAELADAWGQGPVISYGAVMKGYVAVPPKMTEDAAAYLAEAQAFVSTLKPK